MKKIPLTQGKFATVDDEDFNWLNQWKWCAHRSRCTFYAVRSIRLDNGKQTLSKMHREILNIPEGMDTDHINGDGLDNRRENLRVCTHSENMRNSRMQKNNTSGFKGVCWHKRDQKWHAYIKVNNQRKHIGYYSDPIDAAKAYDEAALKEYGEFAKTNKALSLID